MHPFQFCYALVGRTADKRYGGDDNCEVIAVMTKDARPQTLFNLMREEEGISHLCLLCVSDWTPPTIWLAWPVDTRGVLNMDELEPEFVPSRTLRVTIHAMAAALGQSGARLLPGDGWLELLVTYPHAADK